MYLHRLDLRAIGPYPDLVTIDFAALAASGVFLLEGPTGSGKSTIIDAVVFALYGGLAGSDASNDRLHSQHADPAVEPFVELVFETGAGVFRVRRTPQYDRPKQRGSGTVRQQASAQLFRLAGPTDRVGEPVSSRIPEVGLEIARAVGLDRQQFLQTVVLPQGEFARFLRSPGEERRKLLQSLFGTEVYDRTAAELAERRRAAAAEVEAADAAVRDALARFHEASGSPDAEVADVPEVVAALRASSDTAAAAHAAARAIARSARVTADETDRRLAALDRRDGLLARRAALDAEAARTAQARIRVADAERAARVMAVVSGLDAARARATTARAAAVDLRSRAAVGDDDLTAVLAGLRDVAAAVRHQVAVEQSLAGRRRGIADGEHDADALRRRLETVSDALAARPAERAAIVDAARAAAERAADLDAAQRELEATTELGRTLQALGDARGRVTAAEAQVRTAGAAAQAALATENDLRGRRIAGLAGELGAALAEHEACPVCGSTEHPAVAAPQDDHPSAEQIDAAADDRSRAEAVLATASTGLALAHAEADRLADAVGDTDAERLAVQTAAARERLATARSAVTEVAEHERRKTEHDEGTRRLEADRNDVDARLRVLTSRLEGDRERLASDAAAVADALARVVASLGAAGTTGAIDMLETALGRLDARIRELVTVVEADDRAAACERDVADREHEVRSAVDEQGFADLAAARAAVLPDAETERLRAEVTAAEREHAVVTAGLAEPDVVAAADDDRDALDPVGARAAAEQRAAELEDAARVAATAEHRAAAAARCGDEVDRAVALRAGTSARSRAAVRMADVATATTEANPTGITLGTYVLMRRFEDVVAAANDRLRAMLGGRFTLEPSDEREAGSRARRTGLALAVRDHTTGTTRDPRSLSGGETFTFSLCLALGLADVVQAEAGGVSLGTLFVDEGFGTLDPETLDDVIGQLSRLTAGGRQVGIVSHVEELKQRIPERIAVRRQAGGGSRVTTTV